MPLGLKNNKYLTMEIDKEQIKEYLQKFRITSKEQLATHIEELKRNTVPNTELISELVYVLEDDYFFRAPHTIQDLLDFPKLRSEGLNEGVKTHIEGVRQDAVDYDYTLGFGNTKIVEWTDSQTGEVKKVRVYEDSDFSEETEEDRRLKLAEFYKEKILQESNLETPLLKTVKRCSPQCFCDGSCKTDFIKFPAFGEKGSPLGVKIRQEGVKQNKNKPQMSLLFKQFPKALEAVVMCSQYGHEKYKETDEDYLNYTRVDGGSKTYADAGLRHRLEQGNDLESGLPHQFHVAWNALAELELWIRENENK